MFLVLTRVLLWLLVLVIFFYLFFQDCSQGLLHISGRVVVSGIRGSAVCRPH